MDLPKEYFLEKLYELRASEESMKSMALYVRTFSDKPKDIEDGIKYVYDRTNIYHRLVMYYLMNELLCGDRAATSSVALRGSLKGLVKKCFIEDKNRALGTGIYKKYQQLQELWESHGVINFSEKFSLEEVLAQVTKIFKDKPTLVKYLEDVVEYSKNNA